MKRRQFLKVVATTTTAMSLGPNITAYPKESEEDEVASFVDIHCHIFNATDIPLEGFVTEIYGKHEFFGIPVRFIGNGPFTSFLVHLLAGMILNRVPSASEELKVLQGELPSKSKTKEPNISDVTKKAIENTYRQFYEEPLRLEKGLTPEKSYEKIGAFLSNHIAQTRALLDDINKDTVLHPRISRRLVRIWLKGLIKLEKELIKQSNKDEFNLERLYTPFVQWLSIMLSRAIKSEGGYLHAIKVLRSSRKDNLDKLIDTFGNSELFTPSLVDMEKWIRRKYDYPNISPLIDQIAVNEVLIRKYKGKMHPFVSFDPLNQYIWSLKDSSTRGECPLDMALNAVKSKGFIGIKLYPPMGFKPIDNYSNDKENGILLEELRNRFPICLLDYFDPTDDDEKLCKFLKGIDSALRELYMQCIKFDIPIMAHGNDSNEAEFGSGKNALAEKWIPVLEKYDKLRLNIGHASGTKLFLGFDQLSDCEKDTYLALGQLLKNYDNVYADLSYHRIALPKHKLHKREQDYITGFSEFLCKYPDAVLKIMYGSDWHMLAKERKHRSYAESMNEIFSKISINTKNDRLDPINAMRNNALMYLGVHCDKQGGNYSRLKNFWGEDNLPGWMKA